jgi:hypothetical protein
MSLSSDCSVRASHLQHIPYHKHPQSICPYNERPGVQSIVTKIILYLGTLCIRAPGSLRLQSVPRHTRRHYDPQRRCVTPLTRRLPEDSDHNMVTIIT